MRKFILSLVAGALVVGGLAFVPAPAMAAVRGHPRVAVRRHDAHWHYHYSYRLPTWHYHYWYRR
jgi:hypothetical protein